LKSIEVDVQGISTTFNFDLFTRDDDGNKLENLEKVKLQGPGSQISGIEGLAMSIELLPRLKELSICINGTTDFADQFV